MSADNTGSAPLPTLADVDESDVVQLYPAQDGWRWRYCVAGVDQVEILADGGQGYEHRVDAFAGLARVLGLGADASIPETVTAAARRGVVVHEARR